MRPYSSAHDDFHRLDVDRSGCLSRAEVLEGLRARRLPATEASVDAFFATADQDGNGVISLKEYQAFAVQRTSELHGLYRRFNATGDGRLTTEELRRASKEVGMSVSSEQLRQLHAVADRDNDGVISFEEWVSFLLLLPKVNPAAVFEAFGSCYVESAASEYAQPAEVIGERHALLAALASKVYSGSIAGGISRTLTAPIDRLKTLMQAAPPGQSSSLGSGLRSIYHEGGLAAFWRGNRVNVLKIAPETSIKSVAEPHTMLTSRSAAHGARLPVRAALSAPPPSLPCARGRFVAFDQLKSSLAHDRDNVTVRERLLAGGSAGAIAQASIYPLEICKTRMAVSPPGLYAGLADCVRQVVRGEGAAALYQGLGTSLVGIVPYAGIDLSLNSKLKELATGVYAARQQPPGVLAVLTCGMLSSTAAMLVTYPLNLVRTRLQASGMPGSPTYEGPLDCLRQTVRAGGLRALYQGVLPNMLKVLPATSISYAVYDRLAG